MEYLEEQTVEEPPSLAEEPPDPWADVRPEEWNDWRWQLRHSLRTVEQLERVINLSPEERAALANPSHLRVQITPYVASLIDPNDPNCPIRRQVIPTLAELVDAPEAMDDSLAEEEQSPVPGLVHRYPDRVLFLVTTLCAAYCRYCTRSRIVGHACGHTGVGDFGPALDYIAAHPEIRDVLISGGDPLTLSDSMLERLLSGLRAIPHVEVIRIGTRVPFYLPQRITPELVNMIRRYHPVWMNIHFNHPKEVTPEVSAALNRLADAGIPLGSQTVLLAGVNDCPNIIMDLCQKMVRNRVRPYYIYQCDMVHGAGHFRTPVQKGMEIMEAMRGHTSGFAIPLYVIDAPNGGGKVPILPNYLLSMSDTHVVVRNYEGMISNYAQPEYYEKHDPSTCGYCQEHNKQAPQSVSRLLSGEQHTILPAGWSERHNKHH